MARHKELDEQKVLHDIYTAAVEVLAAEGFEGLSIRKICKLANVSTGTFYQFYPTKQDLLHRLLDYMENYYKNDVVPYLKGTGLEKLYDVSMAFVKRMIRRDLSYAKKYMEFDNNDTLTLEDFKNLYVGKVFYDVAGECVENGEVREKYTTDDIAMMAKSLCYGVIMNYTHLNGTVDVIDISEKTLEAFINGIRK